MGLTLLSNAENNRGPIGYLNGSETNNLSAPREQQILNLINVD